VNGWRSDGLPVGRTGCRTVGLTAGASLLELLVALSMLALLGVLSTVAVTSLRRPDATAMRETMRTLRSDAIRTGQPITARQDSTILRFMPDGRVLGGVVDPLTGAWPDAR